MKSISGFESRWCIPPSRESDLNRFRRGEENQSPHDSLDFWENYTPGAKQQKAEYRKSGMETSARSPDELKLACLISICRTLEKRPSRPIASLEIDPGRDTPLSISRQLGLSESELEGHGRSERKRTQSWPGSAVSIDGVDFTADETSYERSAQAIRFQTWETTSKQDRPGWRSWNKCHPPRQIEGR